MGFRRRSDGGRQAVAWLATALVFLQGAVATAFVLLAVSDQTSWQTWAVWASLFVVLMLILVRLNRPDGQGMGWQSLRIWLNSQDREDPLSTYRLRKRRTSSGPAGNNQPPTLESLREAKDSPVRWVPRGMPAVRKRPGREG